jgi:hypothetical protein
METSNYALTAALYPVPLVLLPLLEKVGLVQWRMIIMPGISLMMPGMILEILFISIITGKTAHDSPKRFDFS